jgi:hypothetical protein
MPVVAMPSSSMKCASALTARVQFGHTGDSSTASTPSRRSKPGQFPRAGLVAVRVQARAMNE